MGKTVQFSELPKEWQDKKGNWSYDDPNNPSMIQVIIWLKHAQVNKQQITKSMFNNSLSIFSLYRVGT